MKKFAALLFWMLCVLPSVAAINCTGIPSAIKVGEFGSQEGYLIVSMNNLDFRLGLINDPAAKARFAVLTAAIVANIPVLLRFWDPYSTCSDASAAYAIPNSVQVLQQ